MITVLDKGHVELVRCADSDLDVVNAARVSFDNESDWEFYGDCDHGGATFGLSKRDTKLIYFLARGFTSNEWQDLIDSLVSETDPAKVEQTILMLQRKAQHWAPFAHPTVRFRIKTPIFVARQLFKHKVGGQESEISRRYVKGEPEFYEPKVWRAAPEGNIKQGSGGGVIDQRGVIRWYEVFVKECQEQYETLLKEDNVAPEMTRMVLPQSMYTEWIWTGSLAFFARVYNQRSDSHAQWETQQYAKAIGEHMKKLFPVSWDALTG